uniref:Caspase recruitment domain family member 9 n=1 Tax=Erpetoichthys calabaricus TaxID=27687 RepID=A0A8C4ST01_ERPCA
MMDPDGLNNSGSEDEDCWNQLENYRLLLCKAIEPSRITPYLRQCRVLSTEDEEQIFNDPNLIFRRRKVDTVGESGLTQFLMSEVTKLQKSVKEEKCQKEQLSECLATQNDTIKQLQVKDSELRKQQERVRKMKEERDGFNEEARKLRDENYKLLLEFAKLSEEKNTALMKTRDLQLEIEKLKHSLMNAENDCKVARTHTKKLKHDMEQRPSQDVIWQLQRENDLLRAQCEELKDGGQVGQKSNTQKDKMYIQILEGDRQQSLEEHQHLVNNIYNLRKELRRAEDLCDKYVEEKEVLELQCLTLKKDSKMYKDRIEAILKQLEEVTIERDQAIKTREQLHSQFSRSLMEKDQYRKQIRELGERCDELQIQLFRSEGEVLAMGTKLRRINKEPPTPTSDSEDLSPRSSQDLTHDGLRDTDEPDSSKQAQPSVVTNPAEKMNPTPNGEYAEKRRINFEAYRRKRALKPNAHSEQSEANLKNTTGSDNTDTDSR